MDFTVNMMENRGLPVVSQASATMGGTVNYQTPQFTGQAHQNHAMALALHQVTNHSHQVREAGIHAEPGKVQVEITKEDCEDTFEPPSRVGSVGTIVHHDNRVEKGTDTMDFEPAIKVEIRGVFPGFSPPVEKDKGNVVQLHFNSVSEVLHYFSQKTTPQLDAFNLLANPELVRNINPELVRNINPELVRNINPELVRNINPELVRNINPELVRNHFLYVPSAQEAPRPSANTFSVGQNSQAPSIQSNGSPIIVSTPGSAVKQVIKQERRRGELPPGTIIHRHVQLEVLPNQFVCWICGIDLQKSVPFEEHMADQHSVEKPYKCDDCGVMFKRKAHLDRHRRIHLSQRPYQCGVCGKGFTRNEHVRRHAFTHSGEKPFTCSTCTKTFSRREHLIKHQMSHAKASGPHSPSAHPATPGIGSGLLLQATDQSGRILTIGSASNVVAASGTSTSTSAANNGNIYHISTAAPTSQGSRQQSSGEPVSRPYQCGVCGKAFIRNEHLRRHVLTHSGEKPHTCGTCSKAFSRKEHLTKHIRSHNKSLSNVVAQQVAPPGAIQITAANTLPNSQSSLANHVTVSNGILSGAPSVASSSNQITAAHTASASVAHSIATSHPSSVPHPHLPPGTYLPMFSLLAEVV